ncbi:uncharacterized protein LOC123969506 isoform X2 [Micropterus dolomieu]|uniref:uncharacterized protein LOC123969506 isoform X2 n=1 Tax=Micropterus dolomieu TaxID=147949 RepID=UPI001E8CF53C|nr:uncharacterized protein LOC123969506 isoform X2 [Micropterus dolomieu]
MTCQHIKEDMCEPMLQSFLHMIIPRIEHTLQGVAKPTCDGFASAWQYFLETCDYIIDLGSKSTSVKDIKKEAVDMCAVMFWRLVSRYPRFSVDSTQLTAVLCRVKEKVVKHLEAELLALRSHLILEMILQITLLAFTHAVGEQDLSHYYAMVNSEQALFFHPDTISPCSDEVLPATTGHASPGQSQQPLQLQL